MYNTCSTHFKWALTTSLLNMKFYNKDLCLYSYNRGDFVAVYLQSQRNYTSKSSNY